MHTLVLSTGSNLGNRKRNLQSAVRLMEERIGAVKKSSSVFESPAWGYRSDNFFYNQCHELETELEPGECMSRMFEIEKKLGREQTTETARVKSGYSDRIIDIDILFYDDLVVEMDALTIPHGEIPNRKFVLVPLAEILPDFRHPVFHKTVRELLEICPDTLHPARIV